MIKIPRYIEELGVRGIKPTFQADSPKIDELYEIEVPVVSDWMLEATERAKLAFAAAAAEWVVWRLDGVADIKEMLQFIEALWAAVIDYRYAREIPKDAPEDEDPVRYVLFETWQNANALFLRCQKADGDSDDCVRLALLARHVLPKKHHTAFKEWLAAVMRGRVGKLWQVDESEEDREIRQGPQMPREAFDPNFDFDASKTKALLRVFLKALDYSTNPYLRSPGEMKKLGFRGTPYTL